ncbi:hypothetical protein [Streptomyces sp. NPDC093589]|uniref:hypothetical protein n=1 Tax=Streptomyces sp. NPDC093589 TaxID=3366043 RepID=UPI003822F476
MMMQDGGTVDVRPGPDPGRAAPEHSGAYLAAGLCLLLQSAALIGWTVHGIAQGDGTVMDFFEGLFNPTAGPGAQLLGPYEWAFALAFLVIARLTLAQRRVARTAALLCGFVLLALSAREGVGLFDAAYRDQYSNDPLGGWMLATRGLGLLTALVVLVVLLPANERRGADGPGGTDELDAWWRRPSRICGVLFLALGAAQLAWTLRTMTSPMVRADSFLHAVVDGSVPGTLHLETTPEFAAVGTVAALLTLGALALRGRRDVRGALLVFASVQLYLTVRTVVLLAVTGSFNRSFDTHTGMLATATSGYALAAMTSVVVLSTGRGAGVYAGSRAWALHTPE